MIIEEKDIKIITRECLSDVFTEIWVDGILRIKFTDIVSEDELSYLIKTILEGKNPNLDEAIGKSFRG